MFLHNEFTAVVGLIMMLFFMARGENIVFLAHPVSTAAIHGTTVQFTCTANGTDHILYKVNGTSASFWHVQTQGFIPTVAELLEDNPLVLRANLTVSVQSLYNNTAISCVAIGTSLNSAFSNTAVLTVQGPLSSVGDLSYTYIDASTVNISWNPPFTLPGTDITGYNISDASNGTVTTNYFTSNTYFVLLLTGVTNSSCDEISITVSGYNGLNGDTNIVSGIYLIRVPMSTPVTQVQVDSNLFVECNFNVCTICPGNLPSIAKISLFSLSNNSLISRTTLTNLPQPFNDIISIKTSLIVIENQQYSLEVTFENAAGTVSSSEEFDTGSIKSVIFTKTNDGKACLECVFSSFSTDTGCKVLAFTDKNTIHLYEVTLTRLRDKNNTKGCIDSIFSKQEIMISTSENETAGSLSTVGYVLLAVGLVEIFLLLAIVMIWMKCSIERMKFAGREPVVN